MCPESAAASPRPLHDDTPSPWVLRWANLIAPRGAVLDFAAGRGRHARWLAAQGFAVTAADRDAAALASIGAGVDCCAIDLEQTPWPWPAGRFAGVVVTRYLHRPRLGELAALLAPGGVLIYETFRQGQAAFGRPTNPDFLLEPGELQRVFAPLLTIRAFEEGRYGGDDAPVMLQRLCAVRDAG